MRTCQLENRCTGNRTAGSNPTLSFLALDSQGFAACLEIWSQVWSPNAHSAPLAGFQGLAAMVARSAFRPSAGLCAARPSKCEPGTLQNGSGSAFRNWSGVRNYSVHFGKQLLVTVRFAP